MEFCVSVDHYNAQTHTQHVQSVTAVSRCILNVERMHSTEILFSTLNHRTSSFVGVIGITVVINPASPAIIIIIFIECDIILLTKRNISLASPSKHIHMITEKCK